MKQRFLRSGPILLLIGAMPLVLAQSPGTDGTQWRITTSMSGLGMQLPAHSMEFCATGADRDRPPPASQNKDCTVTEVGHSGSTVRYAMRCTGAQPMQGEGQITYAPDHYNGTFRLQMPSGEMTMTYEGKKLGACTGTGLASQTQAHAQTQTQAAHPQLSSLQAGIQAQMAQACLTQARSAASPYGFIDALHTGTVQCSAPTARAAYCAAFQNYGPYKAQRQDQQNLAEAHAGGPFSTPFTDSLRLCGLDATALHTQLCARAVNGAADNKDGSAPFLVDQCTDQARTLAARECAARAYTSVKVQYLDFCGLYANNQAGKHDAAARQADASASSNPVPTATAQGNAGAPGSAAPAKPSLQDKAKSVLRGIFNH